MFRVLFVCTGNICRSPTAEGIFKNLLSERCLTDRIEADSAGIGSWHAGDPPDTRSTETALTHGVDIRDQRARILRPQDFKFFNLLLAMDAGHYTAMNQACPSGLQSRIEMLMKYAPESGISDVPDPYYGSGDGFERVFEMIEIASKGLLDQIESRHLDR
ncbi:MAG: low molecular weight protein-tyrosine-phosphatase [Pseudomonadota bacterium]|nr:low molecular weight protein-tyrosine-phosphatase [Pseudomonadota bacterium]